MPQRDRTLPANRKQFRERIKLRAHSNRTLRSLCDMHTEMIVQLEPIFGGERACAIAFAVSLRIWP